MSEQLQQQANVILNQALDLPADQRIQFVAQACQLNPALHKLVSSLLRHLDQLDDFLESPAHLPDLEAPAPVPQAGDIIGNWCVIRELGRGGMGLIFLVERSDGAVKQTAALKIVSDAVTSEALLQRFHSERQILANLNHPDIARLIDAGSTTDGRPYFVMEYMNGVAIDQYCAVMKLNLHQRIHLFARVCQAVHYAHQHLIIHRDLKPANILVAADGSLKLLDFGIAKLLDHDAAEQDSGAASWLLTPMYASPEQLAGQVLSISTDVYSLGVILYGLLTGKMPYHFDSGSLPEILHQLTKHVATRPSEVVTKNGVRADATSSELASDEVLQVGRKLARQLRGDLDNILLKAINKLPESRYASADDFRQDLQRYLSHQPIQATPPSWHYRLRKMLQRYPWVVAASTVTALSLVVGTGLALWQAREATKAQAVAEFRFDQTRQLARSMLFEINDSLEKGPTIAREKLLATALQYLKQLAADQNLQPDLKRDVASAYERIGDIVGNQTVDNLGRTKEAERYYQEALKLRLSNSHAATMHLDDLKGLLAIHHRLGDIAWAQGRAQDAQQNYQAAITDAKQIFDRTPTPAAELEWLSRRRYGAAILYTRGQANVGQLSQAIKAFSQLKLDLETFMQRHQGNSDALKVLVPVLSQLVDLYRVTGDLPAANQTSLLSLAQAEKKLQENVDDPRWRRQLTVTQRQIGDILIEQGQYAEGFKQLRLALAIRQSIAEKDAGNERAARDVAIAHSALADALEATQDYAGAQAEFQIALDRYVVQARSNPNNAALQAGLLELQLALANTQYLQGKFAAASFSLAELRNRLADLPKAVALPAAANTILEAKLSLLQAQIEVRPNMPTAQNELHYQNAQDAVSKLLKESENDPLDTYMQRESAVAWQKVAEIGLRAGQITSACQYFDLASKRYDLFDTSKRLNYIDKNLRQQLLQNAAPCSTSAGTTLGK